MLFRHFVINTEVVGMYLLSLQNGYERIIKISVKDKKVIEL